MPKVKVFRQGVLESEFESTAKDQSLLSCLQSNNIDALYHCKEGFCGACRCKLKSGNTIYINEPLAFVRKGEILTCCSFITEDIEIDLL